MKHLSKWFIATLAGVALFSSSCVDQVKFGDSFLEKAPGVAVTQDTIFGKATYARAFLWNTYSKLYYALPVYWNTVEGKMNTGIFEMMSDCWHSHTDWNGINRKYYSGSYKAGDEDSSDDTRFGYTKAYFTRENNKELLISTHISRFGKFNSWDEWQYIFVNSGNGTVITGGLTPTLEFMEMFPMSNGEPFQLNTATDLFYTDNDYNKPIRDPRLYETMLVNGTQFGDHAAELWIGGRDNINDTEKETGKYATGFGCYKFYKEGVNSLKDKYLQWPYLRLAEMYLIYAEALLKSKNDLPGAIEQVNKVRARVGLGDLAVCNPGKNLTTDADALLEEILRERACELGLEDVRLFDMTRYKREDLFRKQLHGLKIYRNDGGGNTPWSGSTGNSSIYPKPTKFTHEAFPLVNPSRAWWSNFSPKWYLSAFPPSEVNKKYGLTQNPGWN